MRPWRRTASDRARRRRRSSSASAVARRAPAACAPAAAAGQAVRAPGPRHDRVSIARYPAAQRLTDQSISRVRRTVVRVAAVQLTSTADRERNLATADRLTRAAAAAGAELVVLPEKWPVLGTPEETAAGAEPFDGPALTWARDDGARAGHRPRGRLDRRARPRAREGLQHLGPHRARRRGPRRLPQDPHVRRRGRRAHLPRVRARGGRRRGRALRDRRRRRARADRLLRPALPRAVPDPRRPRRARDHRAGRLHAGHHARPLGGAPARPRDRGPGVRDRRQPGRRARARATAPAGAR